MTILLESQLIEKARAGYVVSFPTDTVPALAVLPEKSALIFSLKKRPPQKPLILMGASAKDLWPYVKGSDSEQILWEKITKDYWPGALTLVLPASEKVPPAINHSDPTTIGIRVPNHQIARAILSQTGPLATTSANLSGQPPLETMSEIAATFEGVFVLDCLEAEEKSASALPSTVALWTNQGWKILRQGSITL